MVIDVLLLPFTIWCFWLKLFFSFAFFPQFDKECHTRLLHLCHESTTKVDANVDRFIFKLLYILVWSLLLVQASRIIVILEYMEQGLKTRF